MTQTRRVTQTKPVTKAKAPIKGPSKAKAPSKTRYEEKMARIKSGAYRSGDFILAGAKDADLSGGIATTGLRRAKDGTPDGNRTRQEFLQEIRALAQEEALDIILGSSRTIETLTDEGVFKGNRVHPAFRANDATDIWANIRGGTYDEAASMPFRSANLSLAQAQLCLYSMTFNNDVVADKASLEAYLRFITEARVHGKQHFLEVFNPNIGPSMRLDEVGGFVNDCIVRCLAGLTKDEQPAFLKVAYNGARPLSELVAHDTDTIVGVLGGGSGTLRDTFELLEQAERFGARIALFGRKINCAGHQVTLVRWMRRVEDRLATPTEAVKGYHDALGKLGMRPDRDLENDLMISQSALRAEST